MRSVSELEIGAEPDSSGLACGKRVRYADHPAVAMDENHDHGGGHQRADLQQDEDWIVAMKGEDADHQAAREPHRPRATANTRRTVLARQVYYLRQIGEHGDDDAGNADELKHLLRLTRTAAPLEP